MKMGDKVRYEDILCVIKGIMHHPGGMRAYNILPIDRLSLADLIQYVPYNKLTLIPTEESVTYVSGSGGFAMPIHHSPQLVKG